MSRIGTDCRRFSRVKALRNWVAGLLGGTRHEGRVAAIASSLVKITAPLHNLTAADLRLLKMAAIVHDVGRCRDDRRHPAIGARMIRETDSLPLGKRQRRALAFLTLRHRGAVPDIEDDRALCFGGDVKTLRLILGFLRAADALDSRSLASPRLTFRRRGRQLRINCRLGEDSSKARRVFARRKKFRLLEEMLSCKIEVAIDVQRRLRAVA